jgi:polysulfide reductase chain C
MNKHVWTWPIASYLFLGGLGAGMTIIATLADLCFGIGELFALCSLAALVALGLGSALLIFELGRPLQFWRVFSTQRAVLTFGAWMVVLLCLLNLLYFSFWLGWFPWSSLVLARSVIAVLGLLVALGVLLYTGVELSSMKARVFWNTPALPALFAISGVLTGVAADSLLVGLWPYAQAAQTADLTQAITAALTAALVPYVLNILSIAMIVLTLIVTLIYVLMMYTSATAGAREVAARWLSGRYAGAFWGGLIVVGLVLPLLMLMVGDELFSKIAAVLVIVGGIFLRFLVVYSDDRRQLKGEADWWGHLPKGNEPFLKSNWG